MLHGAEIGLSLSRQNVEYNSVGKRACCMKNKWATVPWEKLDQILTKKILQIVVSVGKRVLALNNTVFINDEHMIMNELDINKLD